MLSWFGLHLTRRLDIGHIGEVHHHTLILQLPLQLSHTLEERQALDISHRTTYLSDHKVILPGQTESLHITLNLIGDMRDHLHRLTEEVTPTLPLNHILIDSTRSDIIVSRSTNI